MKKILLFTLFSLSIQASFAQWTAMGSGFSSGQVNALCVHNGELYAGGTFTGRVSKWNNTNSTWTTVGALTGNSVRALISYGGALYAGGEFTMTGNKNNVAKLSGTSWVAVGDGLAGTAGSAVNCFYNFNGTLLAGGTFSQSGTAPVAKVGKWSGTAWQQVGGNPPPHCTAGVYAMLFYAGNLYVGGQGSQPNMERLTGETWDGWAQGLQSAGDGPDSWVYALDAFAYGSASSITMFVGGTFQQPSARMATYTTAGGFGVPLNPFSGTGVNAIIHSPNVSTGFIFAGGTFSANSISNVAKKKFNLPWEAPTTGTNLPGDVKALCFYNSSLVAGGTFTSPGNRVARFSTTVGMEEAEDNIIVNSVVPNPVISQALIKVQSRTGFKQPVFRMLNTEGKEVLMSAEQVTFDHSNNLIEYRIDRDGLAAGLYYYLITDGDRLVTTGKVVIE